MKTARLLVAAASVISLASLPLMAQSVNASTQQSASGSAAGVHENQSADAGASARMNRGNAQANGSAASSLNAHGRYGGANASGWAADSAQMRPVAGELEGKLDSKTAKVGEPVMLRTTQKMKTAAGFIIPRGSRFIGHVTDVQAHERGHEQSTMGVVFDRAELKNGQNIAIHSVIESVGPSAAQLEAASMANDDAFAGPAGGAVGSGAAGGRAGGGLFGGGAGVVGGAASAVGGVGSGVASTAGEARSALNAGGSTLDASGGLAGNAATNLGRSASGPAGAVGSLGVHATAIPGVM